MYTTRRTPAARAASIAVWCCRSATSPEAAAETSRTRSAPSKAWTRLAASSKSPRRTRHLFHAAACGTVLTLLGLVEEQRDPALSHLARDAALAAITIGTPVLEAPGPIGAAVALRAVLDGVAALTAGERAVMREWLDRVAAG